MSAGAVHLGFKIHTRRTDQLRNHHALGTIDDKGALLGHFREVTQEDVRFYRLRNIGAGQQHRNIKWAGISEVAFNTLIDGVLGVFKPIFKAPLLGFRAVPREVQLHAFVVRFNWRNFMKEINEALFLQAFEGIQLDIDQIGEVKNNRDTCIRFTACNRSHKVLLKIQTWQKDIHIPPGFSAWDAQIIIITTH